VVGRQSGWVQIANSDGSQTGWVYEELVEPVAGRNSSCATGQPKSAGEGPKRVGQGVGLASRHAFNPISVFARLIRLPRREERHSKAEERKPTSSIN